MFEEILFYEKVLRNYSKYDLYLRLIINLWGGVGSVKVDVV